MPELYSPGSDNLPAGKYKEVGPGGKPISNPRIIEIDQGDRLPPTQKSGNKWVKD